MRQGFFSGTEGQVRKALPMLPKCGQCGLHQTCRSPKMPPTGRGKKRILVVGEAPGKDEDRVGRQFVGQSGQIIREALRDAGVDLDRDCWSTNALVCHPVAASAVKEEMIDHCRPNLFRAIKELNPELILLLGRRAVASLCGHAWKDDVGPVRRWVGWRIPSRSPNAWVCPTYHPNYLLQEDRNRVLRLTFDRHVRRAVELAGTRPWRTPPDYRTEVCVIVEPGAAATALQSLQNSSPSLSFDFETNCLKPDAGSGKIVCCAVSNGKVTIAYPWAGEAIAATKRFLQSDVPKVGYNAKFESRWVKAKLGGWPRNWIWDGMTTAHLLDPRRGMSGLKFQAYVRLGQDDYNSHVRPYLEAREQGGYTLNRIKECDLRDVLLYCGLDALLEHKVATLQKKEFDRVRLRGRPDWL